MTFLAQSEDFGSILFWILFVLLPLGGRLLRWLGERGKTTQAPDDPVEEPAGESPEESEIDGAEMWRRLLRGEGPVDEPEPEAPPVAQPQAASREPVVRPVVRPMEPLGRPLTPSEATWGESSPATLSEAAFEFDTLVASGPSREGPASGGEPSSPLGGLRRRMEAKETDQPEGLGERQKPTRASLANAILWSEILGPPLALRPPAGE